MQKNIAGTIFYSLLFAMGGAPTIAMMIIQGQTTDPDVIYSALIGLSVIIACILVPIILLQNAFLFIVHFILTSTYALCRAYSCNFSRENHSSSAA
jgi:hypothetical protein